METGTVLGGAGLFISILGVIYSAINHKHIRSKCCGKLYEVSIDIDPTESAKKVQAEAEADKAEKGLPEKGLPEKGLPEKGIPKNEIINK